MNSQLDTKRFYKDCIFKEKKPAQNNKLNMF